MWVRRPVLQPQLTSGCTFRMTLPVGRHRKARSPQQTFSIIMQSREKFVSRLPRKAISREGRVRPRTVGMLTVHSPLLSVVLGCR